MRRYFLTHIVPEGKEAETNTSIAACNFSRNLMSGGMFDAVYSIPPVYVSTRFDDENRVHYPYCGLRKSRGVLRRLAPIAEQVGLFFKIERGTSVWLYNMTMLSETIYLLLRWFKPSVRICTIVLDFTPGAKNNGRLLKRINASDGLIVLADNPLFMNANKVCLPGVVPHGAGDFPHVAGSVSKRFLLSGAMGEQISQISKVLRVFAGLPGCELHISGSLEREDVLAPYRQCPNIHFHGKLPWGEYLELLHGCPFVLSTRDVNAPENQCNFPSKIIEALLHNRIVVSTMEYAQLRDIKILHIANEAEGMVRDLVSIVAMPETEVLNYANQAGRTKELFGVDVWGKNIARMEQEN